MLARGPLRTHVAELTATRTAARGAEWDVALVLRGPDGRGVARLRWARVGLHVALALHRAVDTRGGGGGGTVRAGCIAQLE